MTIGERIKALRESYKMTQTDLAERIGTTKQNVYKYENGIITNIPSDKIEQIAKLFDVSPAYIMGWTEKKRSHRNR
jgi:repressor LexA